ncbi:MAG: hypothetical protein ACYTET_07285 [Planctomycetota bacterium]|jgi:hypothetical protein
MSFTGKLKQILRELRVHAPFTFIGAATGLVLMLLGRLLFKGHESVLFAIFHPAHVLLSAMVTAALFEIHRRAKSFVLILIIGIVGSIGVATVSDCILPFFGEEILGVAIPKHADLHVHDHGTEAAAEDVHVHDEHCDHEQQEHAEAAAEHIHTADCEHEETAEAEHEHTEACAHEHEEHVEVETEHIHSADCDHGHEVDEAVADAHDDHAHEAEPPTCDVHDGCGSASLHLGFIEEWYLVFPAAILGVLLAYFKPATKFPHATHVLLSTWASSAHILMNTHADLTLTLMLGMLIVLFIAVWLPCCVSDIIFPLLFVRSDGAHIGHSCCMLCGKKEDKGGDDESKSD